jgi:S-adenosyl-L-methionine hydrolase (adenosine-forming)
MSRPIVFLTDYGLDDEFVGVCHGVIARIAPEARVIDLAHGIPPQDVLRGALVLAGAVPYMPSDAVYLAVVDPGVGGPRGAIAVATADGALLVGPDNGLLSLAWQELGGVIQAVEISAPDILLQPVSATFHGRNVFAPAAAHLAEVADLAELGPEVDIAGLQHVHVPPPVVAPGELAAVVLGVDRFGNLELNAKPDDLAEAGLAGMARLLLRHAGGSTGIVPARTFADVPPGEGALIEDSSGSLAVVVNQGNAAKAFGLGAGSPVTLSAEG